MGAHVVYESRLELARLVLADFDPTVEVIVAQPFLLESQVEGKVRRHVPDFLLLGVGRVVVVNVKPADRLAKPEVRATLGWAHRLLEERGWSTEVWSGTDPVVLGNVRFLAGFRRAVLFDPDLLAAAEDAAPGRTVAATVSGQLWRPPWRSQVDWPGSGGPYNELVGFPQRRRMSRVHGEHLASVPSMWRIGVAGGGLPTTTIRR
jgi:hypothetical protein